VWLARAHSWQAQRGRATRTPPHSAPKPTQLVPQGVSALPLLALLLCAGDECMVGPYRTKLLEMGALGALLRAALTSVMDEECDMVVQQVRGQGGWELAALGAPTHRAAPAHVQGSTFLPHRVLPLDGAHRAFLFFAPLDSRVLIQN